ncbi:MAG: hypothetical protein ACLP1X_21110 [Polyangiaceae bacterium]
MLVLGLVLGGVGATSLDARAQSDDDRAAARAAATQGLRALQDGRYKDALDFCTRAEALMHAPTHLLLIARSQVKLGHLVEAQEAYFRIVRETLPSDAPRAFFDAQASASQEQAALAPRVPTLKVEVEGAAPKEVTLMQDGQRVPSALIGLARPINPGEHTLSAKSATAGSEPLTVTVAEGSTQNLKLTLRPTTTDAAGSASTTAEAGASGGEAAPEHPAEKSSHTGMRVGGWIAVAIGAAGIVAGTLAVLDNRSNRNDANALCVPNGCPDSKRDQINTYDENANQEATLAWIWSGVGVAGMATGVTLLLMSGKSSAPPQTGDVRPWIGARSAGITVAF